jgi:hypothetical protein
MPQNLKRFQESINKELFLIKDRVRDLIGEVNWAEEGRYKEAVVRKTIAQFLPKNLEIGTGFIISNQHNGDGNIQLISKQLDLVIYDGSVPVVFREGDFVILIESAVRAVIEIKTRLINYSHEGTQSVNRVLETLNELRHFSSFLPTGQGRSKFVGLFSFIYEGDINHQRIQEALVLSDGVVNHISLGANIFIRYWRDTIGLNPPVDHQGRCYIRYNLVDLSFAYFISNLLHMVSDDDPHQRYWFSFPIPGTKELHRIDPIIPLQPLAI